MEKPKVVILCGGEGTRMREETEFKPKPLVTIGGMPILWHIMKIYSHHGFRDFVLCLGYKGDLIKQFFLSHEFMNNDFTINLGDRGKDEVHKGRDAEDWNITFAETGLKAMTGSRVKKIEKYIPDDNFLLTYGDGISSLDISGALSFHREQGTIGTLTGVHPQVRWGMLRIGNGNMVEGFAEKPVMFDYVNGGFYCFRKDFFDYLSADDSCVMETKPLEKLSGDRQLSIYKHDGFWYAMDTYREFLELNRMWDSGNRPWKVWE